MCKLYSIEWNMKTWWDDKIQKVVIALWSYCYVLFAWNNWWSPLQIKLSTILSVKRFFQNSSTEHYQYTSKAAAIKLSFWVRWRVMLLICCRLQELAVFDCWKMTNRWLLEGIGSLHKLTSFHFNEGYGATARAWSTFLHRPSMTSIVSLILRKCKLNVEGLKGIAERCNKLTFLHMYFCSDVTDAGISMVIRKCSQLRVLELDSVDSITGTRALCEDPKPTMCFITLLCMIFLEQVHYLPQSPTTAPYREPVWFSSYLHNLSSIPPLYSML
jgi:hypothetical protein